MSITVAADLTQFHREIRALGDRAPIAASRALNRSIASVNTATVRAVAADTTIAQKFVRKAIEITKATPRVLLARLTVTGRRIPLIAFQARGPQPSRGKGQGVTYNLGRGRRRLASGFIARVASTAQRVQGVGHLGVFVRRGLARLPIVERFGPSLPHVFLQAAIDRARRRLALELLDKNLRHEVRFLVEGLKKGA